MARTNFSFAKRQRELAKKKKLEEKRLRKLEKAKAGREGAGPPIAGEDAEDQLAGEPEAAEASEPAEPEAAAAPEPAEPTASEP